MRFLNRNTIGGAIIVCLCLFLLISHYAPESAQAAAIRAAKARQEAMQAGCERISERVAACWTQDKKQCKELEESKAWFSNEFGEYPELACPNARDPLTFGVAVK